MVCATGEQEAAIPDEDDLVEAQITWDLGREFGFRVNDEKAMIEALSKVKVVQDYSVTRKRGRPKKQRGEATN